jgi:hypothetical protein
VAEIEALRTEIHHEEEIGKKVAKEARKRTGLIQRPRL